MKKLQKITVLYNKPEDLNWEADTDTEKSALEIADQLAIHFDVEVLGISVNEIDKISTIKSDLVFNLIEWSGSNNDNAVRALKLLEKTGIAFTGSSHVGYEISCKKQEMKKLFTKNGITTPDYIIFETGDETVDPDFKYPAIVKPAMQHCSMGISQDSLITNDKELIAKAKELINRFNEPVIAEEFITGWEAHVTVFEKNGRPWVLPIAQIVFENKDGYLPVLTYDSKWNEQSWENKLSVIQIAPENEITKKIKHIAEHVFLKLDGHDYSRLDMRIRGDDIFVLEINNNPGIDFTDESGFGLSGKAAGFTYDGALKHIVENAFARFNSLTYDTATS
jgi:D-alanine-D-alanine ligase